MKQVSSPDIEVMDFAVLMDLSGANPVVTITNLSTITSNANALQWVFELYSPSGTIIHKGNFDTPDRAAGWSNNFVVNTNFPRPFNQIEWSGGNPYRIVVRVKDTQGNIFEHIKSVRVCRPKGVDDKCRNTFGKGSITVVTKCHIKRIWIEDKTSYNYIGITGVSVSKVLKVAYPPDDTGNAQASTTHNNFNSILLPINISGEGYQYIFTSIIDYPFPDNITVRIKYLARESFAVNCNLDLSPIACELQKLIQRVEDNSCTNCSDDQRLISIVSAKLHLATIGMMYPQAALDVYKIIDEIKAITGWECDCCPIGMEQAAVIDGAGTAYDVMNEGGDIFGNFTIEGSTVILHLKDFSYEFKTCSNNTLKMQQAFVVKPSVDGQTKTYCLFVDDELLVEAVFDVIERSTTLRNQLLEIINTSGGNLINIDPKCLTIDGDDGSEYSYKFTSTVLAAGTTVYLKSMLVEGNVKPTLLNFLWDQTNHTAAAAKLNNGTLGYGWTVAIDAGKLVIENPGVSKNIKVLYAGLNPTGGPSQSVELAMTKTKISNGSVVSIENVIQSLIDHICQVLKGNGGYTFVIKLLKAIQGEIVNINVTPEDNMQSLLSKLIDAYNNLVQIVHDIEPTDCNKVKKIFETEDTDGIIDSDRLLMFTSAGCRRVSPKYIALKVLTDAKTDPDIKAALCDAVKSCAAAVCAAVTNATADYNAGTQTLSVIITNVGAPKYLISYIKAGEKGGKLEPKEVSAVAGLTTPGSWAGVPAGAYDVYIVALCADGTKSAEYIATTPACIPMTNFNATHDTVNNRFVVTWSGVPANATHVRVEILYPNGGSFADNFAKALGTTNIQVPSGVSGTFTIIARSVCDVTQQWYSLPKTINILIAPQNACPLVQDAEIISLVGKNVTIRILKPAPATGITAYTLYYTPNFGGVTQNVTLNSAGETVDFVLNNLVSGATYSWYVITNCSKSNSDKFNGLPFTIPDEGVENMPVSNSSVTNSGEYPAKWVTVHANGTIIFAGGVQAPAEVVEFNSGEYNNATIKLTPCNSGATAATITVGPTTYNHDSIENGVDGNQAFVFNNVTMLGGVGMDLAWTSSIDIVE